MIKSKVIGLLGTLSKAELREFRRFVTLPMINQGRDLTAFFDYTKQYHPAYKSRQLDKETIYEKLYPGKPYKDHIIRNLASAMLKMLEKYLAFKNLLNSKVKFHRHLINELIERKAGTMAGVKLRKLENLLTAKDTNVENYYAEKNYFENMRIMNHWQSDKQQEIAESIINSGELITYNFLESASVAVVNISNNRDNYNMDYRGNVLESFLSNIDLKGFLRSLDKIKHKREIPEIAEIYSCIIITITNPEEEEYYYRLNSLILKNLRQFSRIEKYNLLVTLGSCTSMKATVISREKYLPELFEIYRIRYQSKLYSFSDNNRMSEIFFYSALRLALALKYTDWAEDFIKNAAGLLSDENREGMRLFSNAQLQFAKKDYRQALNSLSKVHFSNIAFSFEARTLQLQIYYELEEFETALYSIDAYRHFLVSNKSVSEYFKTSSEEFLSIFNKLLKCKVRGSKKISGKLELEILACRLPQKAWLIEKYKQTL